jgi:large subunit ribosomal protein L18
MKNFDVSFRLRKLRKMRVRKKVVGSSERPRMSVFLSNKNIYVQIIDDNVGKTLVSSSTLIKEIKSSDNSSGMNTKNIYFANMLGDLIGKRLKDSNINKIVLDRGRHKFHGRIKAITEAIRNNGIDI